VVRGLTSCFKQPQFSPLRREQVAVDLCRLNGYLDKDRVKQVGQVRTGLVGYMRSEGKDVLETIARKKPQRRHQSNLKAQSTLRKKTLCLNAF